MAPNFPDEEADKLVESFSPEQRDAYDLLMGMSDKEAWKVVEALVRRTWESLEKDISQVITSLVRNQVNTCF